MNNAASLLKIIERDGRYHVTDHDGYISVGFPTRARAVRLRRTLARALASAWGQ